MMLSAGNRAIWREKFLALWRRDRAPLLLLLVVFLVMTYPFALHIGGSLQGDESDTHEALWQNWWLRDTLASGNDLNYTAVLFHPQGLDVSLNPRRWTSFPVWTLLFSLFGDPLAFNLTASLGILFKAYGMYLVGMLLFGRRAPALAAAAFYAFNVYSLPTALQQPNTGAQDWIPWFMLFFLAAFMRLRAGASWRAAMPLMLGAGICFSLNLYMNLKIGILAMLLGGGFALLYLVAAGLWRSRDCWRALLLFALTASLLCAPLLLPVLGDDDFLHASAQAIRTNPWLSVDAFWQWLRWGLASVALALLGVVYAIHWRREVLGWLALAIVFNALSWGLVIYFRGDPLPIYWTPYRIVADNFFFRTLNYPLRMSGIFVFPYSLLIGCGFCLLMRTLDGRRWGLAVLALLAGLLLVDTRIFPVVLRPEPRSAYVSQLDRLEPGALIDIPLGRQPAKYYMSVQRQHQRPIIEGMMARMPADAYDYIDADPVLVAFRYASQRDASGFPGLSLSSAQWQAALDRWGGDGFRYLVLHKELPLYLESDPKDEPADWVLTLLAGQPTIYQDDEVAIYDLLALDADALAAAAG